MMNITRYLNRYPILRHRKVYATQFNGMKTCCNIGNLHLLKEHEEDKQRIPRRVRLVSTYEVKSNQKEESLIHKVFKKIPFLNINRTKTKVSAYLLYEGIADTVNYIAFFDEFDLPDTFYSWFVVTELHIWMLSARAMAEGEEGRFLRNSLVEALWADVAQRVKKLGTGNSSAMSDDISELSEQLQAALIAYDEGLQSTDTILAGALWRRFYQSEAVDLQHLEQLVKYIRKQIALLDNISRDRIFEDRTVHWEPITQ